MKYRLAIFDFDGTLADTLPWMVRNINIFADKYHFRRIGPEEAEKLRYRSASEVLRYLGIPKWRLPQLALSVRAAMARDIEQIAMFEGVAEMLLDLATQGVVLAVISSNSLENVRSVLGPRLAAHIVHYECGLSLFGKPAKIRKVLRQSDVRPEDAVLIGDEIRDSDAAREAKVAFGAVAWGLTRLEALQAQDPQWLFMEPAEIHRAIVTA